MRAEDLDLLSRLAALEAAESFWAFRQFMHPDMKLGWWQKELAYELQRFHEELLDNKRPKLVIEAPPQHGKSMMVADFIAWASGKNPDTKTIYTSFSERLGARANSACQRLIESERYKSVFPGTKLGDTRNREMFEYEGRSGYFRNTTVRGSITGESLDLGIIDDPVKGREEAGSSATRDKIWDWFTDDFFTRFSDEAGMLAIGTRWHIDDPIGRLRAAVGDELRIVSYPAIAVRNEKHRAEGEPLFPELKPLDFLLERKAVMASVNWEALYQQNPQIVGGEIVKGEWFGWYKVPPVIKHRCIYADTAQKTKEHNDFSVFQCWGAGQDGKLYLLDQIRGKWEAPELERRAIAFWHKHKDEQLDSMGQLRGMKVEDKVSGTGLIQSIKAKARIPISGIERTKDKYTRLMDVLGYIESGYVVLPDGAPFVNDFVAECEAFTADNSHMHDDQVDPMMDAITDMLAHGNAVRVWENAL